MPLETASFISQLNVANPLSTDTVSQADNHLRLIKSVLKATFPNLDGPVNATPNQLNFPVPVGGIIMWSGAINAIPGGWHLCDGTNGTPDLRDRFVVGAGSSYAVGATGGAAQVTLTEAQMPVHTHTISATMTSQGNHTHVNTVNDPGHTHTAKGADFPYGYGQGSDAVGRGTQTTSRSTTGITVSIQTAGEHTHAITATAVNAGSGQAHENRPPYYALAYIMKV